MNLYPLNTFKGETKKELEKMVSKIIDQIREETIKEVGGELIRKILIRSAIDEKEELNEKDILDILNKLKK